MKDIIIFLILVLPETQRIRYIKNGLSFAKKQGWNTRVKSIQGGAVKIGSNYINKGQNTLYFEKFNVVNKCPYYFHQYMANVTAALTEGQKSC